MAQDIFMKLTGIKGESEDDAHKGEIDVLAYSWNAMNSGDMHTGGGGGAGKSEFGDLTFTKYLDSASTVLLQHLSKGTHIPEGNLVVRKAGDSPLEYLKFDFKEILVTNVSTGASGGDDRLTENVSLSFREWKQAYTPQDGTGAGGGAIEFAYNIAKNVSV